MTALSLLTFFFFFFEIVMNEASKHTYTHISISRKYKPAEGHQNKDAANVGKEICVKSQKLMFSTKLTADMI